MELRQLRTFVAAAEHENFTRAAKFLSVTQPAISQQIAALERELGVSLFQRRPRRNRLTDAGKHLYRYARKALRLLEKASQDLSQGPALVIGEVHLSSCSLPAETLLPEILAMFGQAYPRIHVRLNVCDTMTATQLVIDGLAEFGFVSYRPVCTQLAVRPLACQELILVVNPQHSFAANRVASVREVCRQPFIMREPESGTRRCLEEAFTEADVDTQKFSIALETNSNRSVRSAVKQGTGIAFLSRAAVEDDLAQGRLVAVDVEGFHVRVHIYLISNPDHLLPPAARAFRDFL